MTTATPTFRVHTVDRDAVWRIVVDRGDGTVTDVALVRWLVELHHPNLARARFGRGLNGEVGRQPARTWGWRPEPGTYRAALLHNGVTVGEVDWVASVRGKADRMTAIMDALAEDCGHADPFPEPRPPLRRRDWDYEPGDHDHRTGKDVAA